jgi:hypothetical protein
MAENDELQEIVESIGVLADRAENDKWALAESIATAYGEFPAYHHGLTSGLCVRLCKSTDAIYNLRDSWELKNLLHVSEPSLSVSHFATLSHLRDKYSLSDYDCLEWLGFAQGNALSVREMSSEISTAYDADPRQAWLKLAKRTARSFYTLFQDAEQIGLPENLYQILKTVNTVICDWEEKLGSWRGTGQ